MRATTFPSSVAGHSFDSLLALLGSYLTVWGVMALFNPVSAQEASSWESTLRQGKGTIVVYYTDADAFIQRQNKRLEGLEYDLMLAIRQWIEELYRVKIRIRFQEVATFEE
ncbi:MAG: hypothetical protein HC880_19460, partial [Bacteroidia bacterium]|nr:hypothetical protein [Bacteroidia bacterium]